VSAPGGRVPDLFVERTASGDASEAERARVLADPDAKGRLDDLVRQNTVFHVRNDGDAFLRAVDARTKELRVAEATRPTRANWWPVLVVGAPLAAVALLLARAPITGPVGGPPDREQTTTKGLQARLRLTQDTPRGVERVSTDEVLFPGDEIRILTVSGAATHGVVVSIDGRGVVTRHFPRVGADTTLPQGQHPLGDAFQLDDAPDFERFVLVSDDAPIDVERVEAAARKVAAGPEPRKAPLALGPGLDQSSFVIRKGQK
jgi:hypothetical protein